MYKLQYVSNSLVSAMQVSTSVPTSVYTMQLKLDVKMNRHLNGCATFSWGGGVCVCVGGRVGGVVIFFNSLLKLDLSQSRYSNAFS